MTFSHPLRQFPSWIAAPQRQNLSLLLTTGLALAIFAIDCLTPKGLGIGILYILVVLATVPLQKPPVTKGAVAGSMVLVLLGMWISPSGSGQEASPINRWLSIFCIMVTGFIVLKNIASRHALQHVTHKLEIDYNLQTTALKEQNRAMLNLLNDLERVKHHLEDKEHRLRVLVDAFPSGMLIVDHLGKVIFANKLIETLFGYSQSELLGQSIEQLVPQRFQHEHSQHRAGFLHHPAVRAMGAGRDLFACRKDGSEFPVEIGLNPIQTPEGILVLISIVDITARKRSEAELERLNQQLRRQNQELEGYAYAVSHDLRAPLRAINNYADFLIEELSSTMSREQQDYLTGITTAVCEAEGMVSDLLDLARLDSMGSIPQLCHMDHLMHQVLQTLSVGNDVHVQLPVHWPKVMGQEYLLKQVFQNLLANGMKFNRSSPKSIEVDWRQEGKEFVRFFIRDNGIGIAPQYQHQIFQIFQRLHPAKEFEGTGIGLAIVKKAVMKLGGEVSVVSHPGRGSIFSFTVPMGNSNEVEPESQRVVELKGHESMEI